VGGVVSRAGRLGGVFSQRSVSLFFLSVLLVCLVLAVFASSLRFVSGEDAGTRVAEADTALRSAFGDVVTAERNGVNVSGLADRLTLAGIVLTEAEVALNAGNSTGAVVLADTCKVLADGVGADARALNGEAVAGMGSWWVPVVLSGVGVGAFLASLYVVWRWFRKYYVRRIVARRPEVSK
jgi:hypothetical protein